MTRYLPWPGRFWAKVEKTDDCWHWTGARNSFGYGKINYEGHYIPAHRMAYELSVGPIPAGLTIDHLCRNRSCVNPAHMEPVTNAVNLSRGYSPTALNARKTHCKHGHELTGRNLVITAKGRHCRSCMNAWKRASYKANPEKYRLDRARYPRYPKKRSAVIAAVALWLFAFWLIVAFA